LSIGALFFSGCAGSETPDTIPDNDPGQGQKAARDYLDAANRMLRQESMASAHDQIDMARTREAVENLNSYLKAIKEEKQRSPILVDAKKLARWQKELALTDDEVAELTSPTFTLLDANYLELCFQLGDVARSLDVERLHALRRARLAFDWVIRQVSLQERSRQDSRGTREDDLNSPQFVLQLGHGTAKERALVFLALLQQLGLDGCMIAYPDSNGRPVYWVPGVRISQPAKGRSSPIPPGVYLFDTRLGAPLPGPGGKGIARLDEIRKAPDALRALLPEPDSAQIVPPELARAEVHLACPLSALSPRMAFLQQRVKAHNNVFLKLDPDALQKRFQEVTTAPVRFWNSPKDPNTPTRVLRAFLPAGRGGIDRTNRLARAWSRLVSWPQVERNYPAALRPSLRPELTKRLAGFFNKFSLEPRNFISRGRVDQARKPLNECLDFLRKQKILYQDETENEAKKQEINNQIKEWCNQLANVHLQLAQFTEQVREAGGRDDGEAKRGLEQAQKDRANVWKVNPRVLGVIFYPALAEPLGKEAMYLLSLCMQEIAERNQAQLDRLAAGAAGPELAAAKHDARKAWNNAQGWWQKYTTEFGVSEETLPQHVNDILAANNRGALATAVAFYEDLALDLSRSHTARLMQARALEKSGRRDRAIELLEKDVRDLEALLDGPAQDKLAQFAGRRAATVGPYTAPESFAWLRRSAVLRLNQLQGRRP
jgi:hypothetical protein